MPLPVLLLPPDQNSYTVKDGHTVIATALDGGASRQRADIQNASFLIGVQWTLSAFNFTYLKAFYRSAVNFGADPFNLDLYADSGAIQTYVVRFVPDSLALQSQAGLTFVVVAQLEVEFNPAYSAGDAGIIAAGPSA